MRVALIRDPRIAAIVDDIVVEFGDARYQGLIDRFMKGEEVPYDTLRQVWQNTTQGNTVWDVPIYEEFFRVVRAVNQSLPANHQYRVLLGDPPTDWEHVRTFEDAVRPMADDNRDRHAANLIQKEVLSKNRRALIIYGEGHLWRDVGFPNLASLLRERGAALLAISSPIVVDLESLQPDIISWSKPSIAMISGTSIGLKEFDYFFPVPTNDREQWRTVRFQDQVDAVAYYGPKASLTMSQLPPALCNDGAYMEMRLQRLRWMPPGAPDLATRLKDQCASVPPR